MPPLRPSLLTAAALLGVACAPAASPTAPAPAPIVVPTPVPRPVVQAPAGAILPEDAVTRFGLDAYAHLRDEPGNLAFSPTSIFVALSLLHAGAGGKTFDDLSRVMRLEHWDTAGLDAAFADLLGTLEPQLDLANGMWMSLGSELTTSYRERIDRTFSAEVASVDFAHAPEAQRVLINAWFGDHTGGKIPSLLPEGSIRKDTAFVLANAVYFLGDWAQAFDPANTRDQAFRLGNGTTASVPMMHRTGVARFADLGDVRVIELPYEGSTLAMLAVLPGADNSLSKIEEALTPATLRGWTAALHPRDDIEIALPRFQIDKGTDLNQLLVDLGLGSLFDHVDATRMFGRDRALALSGAFHQTVIEVSEKGTEATAATALVVREDSARPPSAFIADQPFLWMIRDTVTGTILFMGRVADPR